MKSEHGPEDAVRYGPGEHAERGDAEDGSGGREPPSAGWPTPERLIGSPRVVDYARARTRPREGCGMGIARLFVVFGVVIAATTSLGSMPAMAPPACTWVGTPGPDVKHGTAGNDVLCGGRGDDDLFGGPGNDRIRGGPGDDFMSGERGDDTLLGEAGRDSMIGRGGNDVMFGGPAIDNGDGGGGNDRVYGGPGSDSTLYGGSAGADLVFGGDGNDGCVTTIDNSGNDAVFGGPGTDHFYTDPGDDVTNAEIPGPCFAE
jgi:hypothetical protein